MMMPAGEEKKSGMWGMVLSRGAVLEVRRLLRQVEERKGEGG